MSIPSKFVIDKINRYNSNMFKKIIEKIEDIKKDYNDEKVIVYGAGEFSKEIFSKTDLSCFNIQFVVDKRFQDDIDEKFFGLKAASPDMLAKADYDILFVFLQDFTYAKKELILKGLFPSDNVKVIEFVSEDDINSSNIYEGNYPTTGRNNKLLIKSENGEVQDFSDSVRIKGLNIYITGNNNTILLEQPFKLKNLTIFIKANNVRLSFGKNLFVDILTVRAHSGNNQCLIVDEANTFWDANIHLSEEKATTVIDKNCTFSSYINIWSSDSHTIFGLDDKKPINTIKKPLHIGEHCWIGQGVSMTKNTDLPKNTVVGMKALVTGAFSEENTCIGGNPAKVIKRNVGWDYHTPDQCVNFSDYICK